jgi:hypothetical protein
VEHRQNQCRRRLCPRDARDALDGDQEFERSQPYNGNVIIELNSILRFLRPDVLLT